MKAHEVARAHRQRRIAQLERDVAAGRATFKPPYTPTPQHPVELCTKCGREARRFTPGICCKVIYVGDGTSWSTTWHLTCPVPT